MLENFNYTNGMLLQLITALVAFILSLKPQYINKWSVPSVIILGIVLFIIGGIL